LKQSLFNNIQLIECPRDAMQGWPHFIATGNKIRYLNSLMEVGFHTLDFGSFVSPKAIPQMADTNEVINALNYSQDSKTKLLSIVANTRGAEEAIRYKQIKYLGFPFSISPSFQMRNTHSTLEQSLETVEQIQLLCEQHEKELVIYLSMGFGNPYGDEYSLDTLFKWTKEMVNRGIGIISLADTIGLANPSQIQIALEQLIPAYPTTVIGIHLHAQSNNWKNKLEAAINAGCKRIDGTIKGIGGCPMAQEDLVGNMDSLLTIAYLQENKLLDNINEDALFRSIQIANEIFQ
jgi:hydroxymethylglutaryl-CoA lyase